MAELLIESGPLSSVSAWIYPMHFKSFKKLARNVDRSVQYIYKYIYIYIYACACVYARAYM
jgi:hypothetical protein